MAAAYTRLAGSDLLGILLSLPPPLSRSTGMTETRNVVGLDG